MKKEERHEIILKEVHLHNRVLLSDLATIMNVSIDTVRRDVKDLDKANKLKKVHGGAVSNGFNIYRGRTHEVYELTNKTKIAQKGVSIIKEGQVILISGGSTNLELVKVLPKNYNLTFFTPSLTVAIELLNHLNKNNEVIFLGGRLSRDSQLATGSSTIRLLSQIKVDLCFLGTGYIDIQQGVTEIDWEIAQLKKAMILASKKVVSLTISQKLNTTSRYTVCPISAIDLLVTELDPEDTRLLQYQKVGLRIL